MAFDIALRDNGSGSFDIDLAGTAGSGDIKKVSSIAFASIKSVGGVLKANIKKVSGVATRLLGGVYKMGNSYLQWVLRYKHVSKFSSLRKI